MRIEAKGLTSPASPAAGRLAASGARFSLPGSSSSPAATATAGAASLSSLDAVLALQGEGESRERRKRAAARGHGLLDQLDRLKVALLSGHVSESALATLRDSLKAARHGAGDPGLDEVLAHIELRAAVELAKLGRD